MNEKFWERVALPEGCWLWTGGIQSQGYGVIKRDGKFLRAHREAYEIFFGEIPEGLMVCHTCDVRHCVNPHHLYLGTALENNRDTWSRGRKEQKAEQVMARTRVMELWNSGKYFQREIGEMTGYSQAHVSRIIRDGGSRWAETGEG